MMRFHRYIEQSLSRTSLAQIDSNEVIRAKSVSKSTGPSLLNGNYGSAHFLCESISFQNNNNEVFL